MVTVDGVAPSAGIGPVPVMVDVDALGGAATNVTVDPAEVTTGLAI